MMNFEELSKHESLNNTLTLMKKYNDKIVTGPFHKLDTDNLLLSEKYYFDYDTGTRYKTLIEMDDDHKGNVYIARMGGIGNREIKSKEQYEEIAYEHDHWDAPVNYYSKYTSEDVG